MYIKWDITGKCNMQCLHCYRFPRNEQELDTKQVLAIIDQLKNYFITYIHFFGGEPLVRTDFLEIAEYCTQMKIPIGFTTNGQLIGEHNAEVFFTIPFDAITVSIESANSETNDYIRGKGSLKKALEAVRALVKAKENLATPININLSVTLCAPNIPEVQDVTNLAYDERVTSLRFSIAMRKRGGQEQSLFRFTLEDLYAAFLNISQTAALRDKAETKIYLPLPPFVVDRLSKRHSVQLYSSHENYCVGGIGEFRIDPYGFVIPCIDSLESFGRISKRYIRATGNKDWNSLKRFSFRECCESQAFSQFAKKSHNFQLFDSCTMCKDCRFFKARQCWPFCQVNSASTKFKPYDFCELELSRRH